MNNFNIDDITQKASMCLNCKKPMCREGCPISNNIPQFISKIKEKDIKAAYEILQENNIMSEICSIVCPVEKQCMSKCVRGIKGTPVEINYLEQYINHYAKKNNIVYQFKPEKHINQKVAIIGSGPAGIACAVELAKAGVKEITIFEKEEKCGGILEYGIPDFRLSKEIVENVINRIKELGITIKNNVELGKDITIEELKKQGYSEIFIGIGAAISSTYKLSDKKANNIYRADDFLKRYSIGQPVENLGNCIVIGGGNVALDSARVAARTGAKSVKILYRRNEELMPANQSELIDTIEDGVKIQYLTRVISANIEDEKVVSVNCIKTQIENEKAVDIENSNFIVESDTVIFAIGSKIDSQLIENAGLKIENGLVSVDEYYKTNLANVYAGGDAVESKSSVCRAIATGKKAAKTILDNIRKESEK